MIYWDHLNNYFRGDAALDCSYKKYDSDYRVNILSDGKIISVEVTCCGRHIGEMRFKNGESRLCPYCGTTHTLIIQHNHFHIRPQKPAEPGLEKATASG